MKRLYDERPRFCDVAIECIPARHADGREDTPEQNVVYAHRAVLAARTSCAPLLSLSVHPTPMPAPDAANTGLLHG